MKLKYYLRGVGTGILFATIILLVSYAYKMSDGQIKKKALELGMVYPTEQQSTTNVADKQTTTDKTSEEETSSQDSDNGETTTKEPVTEEPTTTKPSVEETTTKKPATQETTTKKPSVDDNTEVTCIITVTNRTNSYHVSVQLAQAGIIESADDFNNYLISNGYAYRIQNGTFTFKKGMTYKEMAEYLAKGRL